MFELETPAARRSEHSADLTRLSRVRQVRARSGGTAERL